jgi:hypothetical protein
VCGFLPGAHPSTTGLIAAFKKNSGCQLNIRIASNDSDWSAPLDRFLVCIIGSLPPDRQTEFATIEVFAVHWLRHNVVQKGKLVTVELSSLIFECPDCYARVESATALKAHEERAHVFPCSFCRFVARTLAGLDQHRGDRHYKCPECNEWVCGVIPSYGTESSYPTKATSKSINDKHTVGGVSFYAPQRSGLQPILRSATKTHTPSYLQEHMHREHLMCNMCDKWIENEFRLEIHTELEHPSCPTCLEQFKVVSSPSPPLHDLRQPMI